MLIQHSKHGLRLIGLCLGLAALSGGPVACSDDGDEAGDGDGDGDTAESGETDTDTSETDSESNSGDGDGDPGDGDPGDGDPGDGDPGDGDPGDGDPGDGDGDPMPGQCSEYGDQNECENDSRCQAVLGQPLQENGPDAPCLEPSVFIGCIAQMGCGDAETWFCVGGNAKPHLVPDTCGPADGEECDPGVTDVADCP